MSERDPKYVLGDRPVNRRTAARPATPAPLPAAATQRMRIAQARNRLGPPLAEQLRARAATTPSALSAKTIAGGMLATCGGLGLFLAWLQSSALMAIAGAAGLGIGLFFARQRARPTVLLEEAESRRLLDPAAVTAFDEAVERLSADLPPEPAQSLAGIKQLALRIARHPAAGNVDEHFRLEDRLYVNECLRRYLPDSLQAYFAVPAQQRALPLPDGETAESLLLTQLTLLRGELERREQALARSAAEALLRQERFLRSKARDPRRL